MKRTLSIKHIKMILFALITTLVVIFSAAIGLGLNPAQAQTTSSLESDLEVQVDSVMSMSLTNCDATNNSVVKLDVTPSSAGTFKSNCQTVDIDTNAPGYTLSVYHRNGLPPIESPTMGPREVCQIDPNEMDDSGFTCKDETGNTICLIGQNDVDMDSLTYLCKEPTTETQTCVVSLTFLMDGSNPFEKMWSCVEGADYVGMCAIGEYDASTYPIYDCLDDNSEVVCQVDITPIESGSFNYAICYEPQTTEEVCRFVAMGPACVTEVPMTIIGISYDNSLVYLNPTILDPAPKILSTTNTLTSPAVITNDTWGFAVENRQNFNATYTIDNANNIYICQSSYG